MKRHVNRTCFHVGLKSQTGMGSFLLSCERTVTEHFQWLLLFIANFVLMFPFISMLSSILQCRSSSLEALCKRGALQNLRSSQESTSARVFFWQKCRLIIKKETSAQVFSGEFYKNFMEQFFTGHLHATISGSNNARMCWKEGKHCYKMYDTNVFRTLSLIWDDVFYENS